MSNKRKKAIRELLVKMIANPTHHEKLQAELEAIIKQVMLDDYEEKELTLIIDKALSQPEVAAIIDDPKKSEECAELVVKKFDHGLELWRRRVADRKKRQLKGGLDKSGPLFPDSLAPATAEEGNKMSESEVVGSNDPAVEALPEVLVPAVAVTAEIAQDPTPVVAKELTQAEEEDLLFNNSVENVRRVLLVSTAPKGSADYDSQFLELEIELLAQKAVGPGGIRLIVDVCNHILDSLEFEHGKIWFLRDVLEAKDVNFVPKGHLGKKFDTYRRTFEDKVKADKPKPKSDAEKLAEKQAILAKRKAEAEAQKAEAPEPQPKAEKPKVDTVPSRSLEDMVAELKTVEAQYVKAGSERDDTLKSSLGSQSKKLRRLISDLGDHGRLALHGLYSTLLATELETSWAQRLSWLVLRVEEFGGNVAAEVLEKIEAVKVRQEAEVAAAETKVETGANAPDDVAPAEAPVPEVVAPPVQDEVTSTTEVKDATTLQAAVVDKTLKVDDKSCASDDTVVEQDDVASTKEVATEEVATQVGPDSGTSEAPESSDSAKAEETLVEPASVLTEAPAAEAGGEQVESESTGTSVQAALAVDGEFRGLVAKFEKSLEERLAAASLQIKEVVDRVNANATRVVNELVSYVDNRTEVVTRVTEKTASKAELNERSIEASVSNFNTALDKAMEDQLKDSKSFDSKLEEMKVSLEKKISDQGLDADKMSKRPSRMSNSARFVVAASLFLAFASLASGWWRSPSGVAPQLAKAGVVTPATDSGANKVEFQTETPPKKAKDEVKVVLIDEGNQLPPMKISVTFGETTIADETTLAAIADRSSDAGKVAYLIKQQTATQYKAIPSKEEQLKVWEKVSEVVKNIGTKEVRAKQREIAKAWSIEVNDDGSVICQPQDRERLEGMLANL